MQLKAQSAMEYLMTYGWAILIIVVVAAAIVQLGVFNTANLEPRVQAGSCSVRRPNGIGTSALASLVGSCTNQLPEYVADMAPNGYITVPDAAVLNPSKLTISAWIKTGYCGWNAILQKEYYGQNGYWFGTGGSGTLYGYFFGANSLNAQPSSSSMCDNKWHDGVVTYDGSVVRYYVDGVYVYGHTFATNVLVGATTRTAAISWPGGVGAGLDGQMANIQLYNTTLSANQITTIYNSGIGGVPVDVHHLAAWWPLNGNANDYSGNGNDGTESYVYYSSSWTASYSHN